MIKKIILLVLSVLCLVSCAANGGKPAGVGRDQSNISDSSDSGDNGVPSESSSENASSTQIDPPTPKGLVVCVDPGHGFGDGGTTSELLGDVTEKDITLSIALKLGELLKSAGYDVIFTHDGETFPKTNIDDGNNLFNPNERVAYVNTLDIDLFISIHCDSFPSNQDAKGTRIYYYNEPWADEKNAERAAFAEALRIGIDESVECDVKATVRPMDSSSAYRVIKGTNVTAVLVETGFVTNPDDAANMLTDEWRAKIAEGLFKGIDGYLGDK